MNEKFVPASIKAFPLGIIHGVHFNVVVSRKSGFDGFENHTNLPCLHLSVAADDEKMTWHDWKRKGAGVGLVIDVVKQRNHEIINHFFGRLLSLEDAAMRIELNDQNSGRSQTVHFHLEVGHRDLFGEGGLVRQSVQSLLKPELIEQEAVALRTLTEPDIERVIAAIEKLQPSYFRNVTIGFNHGEKLYSMFVVQVARVADGLQKTQVGVTSEERQMETSRQVPLFSTNSIVDTPPNAMGM